ncbi:MAG: matrixin family metalloprotease [Gemmatimonadota bacterium]|nr:matrixin family metalloprotease [Gemmatimonadota bacterium]
MRPALLPVVTFGLFAMVLADRISDALASRSPVPVVQGPDAPRPETPGLDGSPEAERRSATGAVAPPSAPTIDRLARLAIRQQISREAGRTYLDSLMVITDSVVRRWPDRRGVPFKVCLVEGGPSGYRPRMAQFVQDALSSWENTGMGVRFDLVADTSDAEIVVRWIDHFDFDRAGQTDLTWDRAGRIHRAVISLALRTNTGFPLPDGALQAVVVHEAGHALGLPHSADSNDAMYPATRTGILSERDRRTAQVLYQLQPGPVRDLAGIP